MKIFIDRDGLEEIDRVVEVLNQKSPIQQMLEKIRAFNNCDLFKIWKALENYDPRDFYAPEITMDQWADAVYCEMCSRQLSTLQNPPINPCDEKGA